MSARESIPQYTQKLREYTNFAVRGIRKVCKEVGPREAGSPAERQAQASMAKELESCCDTVRTEPFKTAPHAFLGWINIAVFAGVAAMLLYNIGFALASLILLALVLVSVFFEFLLYKQFLDPLYPKKTSQNVVGVRSPAQPATRRLILCGHADSAYEWHYTYWGDKYFHSTRLLIVVIAVAFAAVFFGLAASIAAVTAENGGLVGPGGLRGRAGWLKVLGYIFAGLCLPLLAALKFKSYKHVVMGANDNLSGCFTSMAVAKLLGDANERLQNTELVVLLSGGEECGLRGAKAFVDAHKESFKDMETAFIALDTMTDFAYMGVYITDMTGTVKHDPALCSLIKEAGTTAGHTLPFEKLFFGASDAAAATQGGLRAAAFAAMDPAPAAYYHTRLDTPEKLESKTIEACLDVIMETAYLYDAEGLARFEGRKVKAGG
jgi:hypothetical protein